LDRWMVARMDMLNELQQKLEIFRKQKIEVVNRQNLHETDLDMPHQWMDLLSNTEMRVSEIIEYLWTPVIDEARDVVNMLSTRIADLAILFDPQKVLPIQMCYIFQTTSIRFNQTYLNAWVAGQPCTKEKMQFYEKDANIELPEVYKKFCGIHNGFLLDGNMSVGFLPLEGLEIIVENKSQRNLLRFCGDGLGNYRCFDLEKPTGHRDADTLDWDHESLEIGTRKNFWDFAYNFITANTKTG